MLERKHAGSAAAPDRSETLDRLSTGDAALDAVLGGGFPLHSITILLGHPGTGKTVLAEQLAFRNADGDRPVLYLTTMSEPLAKVVKFLQRFDFFDAEKMGAAIFYEDIGHELSKRGPAVLLDWIRDAIRRISPKIIIIDSFKAIHDLADTPQQMRRLAFELASVLSAYDVTTFLVGEYAESQIPLLPEFAVADAVVQLVRDSTRRRDERFLRVLKLRGSTYHGGLHAFRLTTAGIAVHRRLVSPNHPPDYSPRVERIRTGTEGLDELLDGGFWAGSSTLVLGAAGSGKTTFGLGFAAEGARSGEPSLYLNLQENPTQLARTIASLGFDIDLLRQQGLHLHYASPVELQIDSIVGDMFKIIGRERIQRVVIDAVGDLAIAANDPERLHDYLYALVQYFMVQGVSNVLTLESFAGPGLSARDMLRLSSISDTIIELDVLRDLSPRRTLRVIKSRGTDHDLRPHEMIIHAGGMRVLGPLAS